MGWNGMGWAGDKPSPGVAVGGPRILLSPVGGRAWKTRSGAEAMSMSMTAPALYPCAEGVEEDSASELLGWGPNTGLRMSRRIRVADRGAESLCTGWGVCDGEVGESRALSLSLRVHVCVYAACVLACAAGGRYVSAEDRICACPAWRREYTPRSASHRNLNGDKEPSSTHTKNQTSKRVDWQTLPPPPPPFGMQCRGACNISGRVAACASSWC
ncbi:hypothetical protein BS50DRAFT_327302 [Corynespora cassiicola Philippines]|uniref:Uncharacterized protein n=1 Tax=Corynespora cassiicola Philippines TaxID=1448308 RepID=A0A2T2NTX1_CORCC|nr:hypothetical protein BS50DRAFT_327302 [Corynespora cassiicola Philippines]